MEGELNLPGVYPLTDGLTLSQAITKAGGITDVGSSKFYLSRENSIN